MQEGTWRIEQLFVNGRRAIRARTPNQFYSYMHGTVTSGLDPLTGGKATLNDHAFLARAADVAPLLALTPDQLAEARNYTPSPPWTGVPPPPPTSFADDFEDTPVGHLPARTSSLVEGKGDSIAVTADNRRRRQAQPGTHRCSRWELGFISSGDRASTYYLDSLRLVSATAP